MKCKQCEKIINPPKTKFCSVRCKYLYWRENNKEYERKRNRDYYLLKMKDPVYVARKRKNSNEYRITHIDRIKEWHDREHFNGNKKNVLDRDEFTCQICKEKPEYSLLAIHHKDGNREHNDIENLITLCDRCHRFITGIQSYFRYKEKILDKSNKKVFEELENSIIKT